MVTKLLRREIVQAGAGEAQPLRSRGGQRERERGESCIVGVGKLASGPEQWVASRGRD